VHTWVEPSVLAAQPSQRKEKKRKEKKREWAGSGL